MKEMDKEQTAQMKTLTDSVATLITVLSGSLANLMQMQTQQTNQSYMFPMADADTRLGKHWTTAICSTANPTTVNIGMS